MLEQSEPSYKSHIDGLRAIAILLVLIYHLFPTALPSGFIGVDIFFVISGYLITGIVKRHIEQGRFSFRDFYIRRAIRILPALFGVLIFSLALGFFILHDLEYRQLAKHAFSALFFLSNFVLAGEKGYFDVESETKPFLHLWSLAIEEQFYLIWPIVILFVVRKTGHRLAALLGLLGISYGIGLYFSHVDPVRAYYFPVSRGWELIAGAALNFVRTDQSRLSAEVRGWLGLAFILAGCLIIDQHVLFPGYVAVLPVLGAACIVSAPHPGTVDRLLSSRLFVLIGKISYSLYLWHWVLIGFAVIFIGRSLTIENKVSIVILSILLSALSKYYIEDIFRFRMNRKLAIGCVLMAAILIGLASLVIYKSKGLSWRSFHERNVALGSGNSYSIDDLIDRQCQLTSAEYECWRDKSGEDKYAVIGDSKAKSLFEGLVETSHGRGGWYLLGGNAQDGAPVPVSIDDRGRDSSRYRKPFLQTLSRLKTNDKLERIVVVVGIRTIYQLGSDESVEDLATLNLAVQASREASFTAGITELLKLGRPVTVVLDNPTFLHPQKCLDRNTGVEWVDGLRAQKNPGCMLKWTTHNERIRKYRDLLGSLSNRVAPYGNQLSIYDPTAMLCDTKEDICHMVKDGHYYYVFTDHLSSYAAKIVAGGLMQQLSLRY